MLRENNDKLKSSTLTERFAATTDKCVSGFEDRNRFQACKGL
jgi:hypothetical protein